MKTNKSTWTAVGMIIAVITLSGCSAALFSSTSTSDDLYSIHNTRAIASSDLQHRERALVAREAELRQQEETTGATYRADQAQTDDSESITTYQSVSAEDPEDAYERRLRGFTSSSYKMDSVAPDNTEVETIKYVSAYEPAVYDVVVIGDEVWVEPKYVSSLFGTWGSVGLVNLSFNFGWGWRHPYWGWNSWNWLWGYPYYYYSWYYPYYGLSWGWNWGWGGYHPSHWGGGRHYTPRNFVYGKPGNSGYRPSTGYRSGSGTSYSRNNYRRSGNSTTPSTSRAPGSNPTTNGGTTYRRRSSGVTVSGTTSSSSNSGNKGTSSSRRGSGNSSSSSGSSTRSSGSPSSSGVSHSSGGASHSSGGGGHSSGGGGFSGGGGSYRR